MWSIAIALGVVAILSVTQAFVVYELIHQLAQVRRRLELDDEPVVQSLGAQIGGPVPRGLAERLLSAPWSRSIFAVFVTTDCTTCQLVAQGARGMMQDVPTNVDVRFVVQARGIADAESFLADTDLPKELVVIDDEARLGQELDLRMRPLTLFVREGRLTEAAVVRNPEQLRKFIQRWVPREEETPSEINATPVVSANL